MSQQQVSEQQTQEGANGREGGIGTVNLRFLSQQRRLSVDGAVNRLKRTLSR